MMKPVSRVCGDNASAVLGKPVIDWPKLLWNGGAIISSFVLAPLFFSWSALFMCVAVTYFSLLIGHSVGMHRFMIHRTFVCAKWLEYSLIYLGTLVGVAGPFGILRIHDLRDWAQRQPEAHDFFTHNRGYFRDLTWQLFYRFDFEFPPKFQIEAEKRENSFYQFMEWSWRGHQLPFAVLLYSIGGTSWVVWGICVRVAISGLGHWSVTYFCHNPVQRKGGKRWQVRNVGVQAYNLPGLGFITYGECWHDNHHAFPESARIGLEKHQTDPGWWVLSILDSLGLIKNIGLPRMISKQDDLIDLQYKPAEK